MKLASITKDIEYAEGRPAIKVILDSEAGKEIRIVFKKGQEMKEHKAPYPIVVAVFEGSIDFGVNGETHLLNRGDMITLPGNMPHNLLAKEDSIVRLSLHSGDSFKRVQEAVNH